MPGFLEDGFERYAEALQTEFEARVQRLTAEAASRGEEGEGRLLAIQIQALRVECKRRIRAAEGAFF